MYFFFLCRDELDEPNDTSSKEDDEQDEHEEDEEDEVIVRKKPTMRIAEDSGTLVEPVFLSLA